MSAEQWKFPTPPIIEDRDWQAVITQVGRFVWTVQIQEGLKVDGRWIWSVDANLDAGSRRGAERVARRGIARRHKRALWARDSFTIGGPR